MPVNKDATYYSALNFFCTKIKEYGGIIKKYYDMRVCTNFIEYTFVIVSAKNPKKSFSIFNQTNMIEVLFEEEKMLQNGIKFIRYVKNEFDEVHAVIRLIKDGWNEPDVIIDSDMIEKMSGVEFEEYIIRVLQSNQIKAERTKNSSDQGVDMIVYFDCKKIAIQCKRYSETVGNAAIQEVFAGSRFYGAQKSMVVTNSTFSKSAIELAEKCNVYLVDKYKLVDFLKFPKIYL